MHFHDASTRVRIDTLGAFVESHQDSKCMLLMVNQFTRWLELQDWGHGMQWDAVTQWDRRSLRATQSDLCWRSLSTQTRAGTSMGISLNCSRVRRHIWHLKNLAQMVKWWEITSRYQSFRDASYKISNSTGMSTGLWDGPQSNNEPQYQAHTKYVAVGMWGKSLCWQTFCWGYHSLKAITQRRFCQR